MVVRLPLIAKYFSAVQNYFPIAGNDAVAYFIFSNTISVILSSLFLRHVIVFRSSSLQVSIVKKINHIEKSKQ